MKRGAFVVVSSLAAAACSAAPPGADEFDAYFPSAGPIPVAFVGMPPLERSPPRPPAPERPAVWTSFDVTYAAIPLLERGKDEPILFSVGVSARLVSFLVADGRLLELVHGKYRAFTRPESASPKALPAPPPDVLAGEIRCDKDTSVVLRGLEIDSWMADKALYREYEGTFTNARCAGSARSAHEVVAAAIVPGILYAFRRPIPSLEGTKEDLVVIGPVAEWVASSTIAEEQTNPHVGSFTFASVPVRLGSSASISLQIHQDQLAHFVGMRTHAPKWAKDGAEDILEIKIDVVWPKEDDSPSAVVFVSQVTPLAVRLLNLGP